jgi:hypothetical protein
MNKLTVGLLACMASLSSTLYAQCGAVIKKAGPNLKIIRSGDLIGDGAREYVAGQRMKLQPTKGLYVSRLLVVRFDRGHCSIVLDARKDGPQNPLGYIGISYIDDRRVIFTATNSNSDQI